MAYEYSDQRNQRMIEISNRSVEEYHDAISGLITLVSDVIADQCQEMTKAYLEKVYDSLREWSRRHFDGDEQRPNFAIVTGMDGTAHFMPMNMMACAMMTDVIQAWARRTAERDAQPGQ